MPCKSGTAAAYATAAAPTPAGLPHEPDLLLVGARRTIVREYRWRRECRVLRTAQERVVARVVVHEALGPRHGIAPDRRVGAVRREVAGAVELRIRLVERAGQAGIERDRVRRDRRDRIVLAAEDDRRH